MNIAPTLEEKRQIIENAIQVCTAMGLEQPKVAALTAVEKVSDKMQATVDAAKPRESDAGISSAIVDGPLSFDLALARRLQSTREWKARWPARRMSSLVPTIEVGNGIGKCMTYFALPSPPGW